MSMYSAEFDQYWIELFKKLDNKTKEKTAKKIARILEFPQKRHLKKGADFFVAEIGQHRITYRVFEKSKLVRFYFVGNHKEYEKWYKKLF